MHRKPKTTLAEQPLGRRQACGTEVLARADAAEMRGIGVPCIVRRLASGQRRVAQRNVAARSPRGKRHGKIAVKGRRGSMDADAGRDQHPRRICVGAGRIAHRRKARPIVLQDRAPVGKEPAPLAPFQIGEPYRLHPRLRAQSLLQAQSLHALSSWRMRSLRLAESSP